MRPTTYVFSIKTYGVGTHRRGDSNEYPQHVFMENCPRLSLKCPPYCCQNARPCQEFSPCNMQCFLLQTALQHLEGMRAVPQGRVDRGHPRDRGRQQIGPLRSRPFTMEKSRVSFHCCDFYCIEYMYNVS